MKPQDEFAVIVAGVVTASTFQLLNSAGVVVAELGTSTIAGVGAAALTMNHTDALTTNSALAWTTSPPATSGIETVALQGPTSTAAGVGGTRSGGAVSLNVQAAAQSIELTPGSAYGGAVGETVAGFLQLSGGTASPDQASAYLSARGNAATNRAVTINSSNVAIDHDALVTLTSAGGRVTLDSGQAMVRHGTAGGYVQAAADHVGLGPTAAGRLFLNARTGYLTTAVEQFVMPASISPGYASFIMNGIAFTGADGDVVEITATIRVLCGVAAGAFIAHPQIFGPGGNVILPQRVIATQWPVNHDAPITGTWRYTLALGGGAYAATIIGGQTGGTWTAVAPDTWMGLTNHGIR